MNNRFFTSVSYILHPLFMPTLGTFIIMWNDPSLHVNLVDPVSWAVLLGTVFTCTALLPLLSCFMLLKTGRITSLQNANDQERRTLMVFAELGFLLAYLTYHNIPALGHTLSLFMLGINIALVATLVINFFQKTSFHATGAGGLLGATIGLMYYSRINLKYWIVGTMVLCFIAGYARYRLKAHSSFEIYLGYIIGIVSLFAVFFFGAGQV